MAELLTPSELIRYVDLSLGTVLKAIHRGELPMDIGEDECRYINLEDAITFARNQNVNVSPLIRMRKKRVLIVDDDSNFQTMLLDVLTTDLMILPKTASSLFEARLVLHEFKPHLIIIDAHLPDGFGWSLMDDISSSSSLQTPAVLGITALSSQSTIHEMTSHGVQKCFAKPLAPELLLQEVRTRLNLEITSGDYPSKDAQ